MVKEGDILVSIDSQDGSSFTGQMASKLILSKDDSDRKLVFIRILHPEEETALRRDSFNVDMLDAMIDNESYNRSSDVCNPDYSSVTIPPSESS